MRFFERPGGFVEVIIPQSVQKEKRQALEQPVALLSQELNLRKRYNSKALWSYKQYITHSAFYQCLSAGSLSPSGCNVSVLQCPRSIAARRTATGRFSGLSSQAVHVLLQLLSVLRQALATLAGKLHEPPPQAAPSQKGCGSCPALRTITVMAPRWYDLAGLIHRSHTAGHKMG